tara:strand:- start:374 stop:1294 length:921 start_codon:yes stop_codon:yes gene_type:complete
MAIQPGTGYTFSSSSLGTNLNIEQPWSEWNGGGGIIQQFECSIVSESDGEGGLNYFVKTVKGVVDYSWGLFPFNPQPDPPYGENIFRSFQRQDRITDWAIYPNGSRTVGTVSDTEYMANDGKVEILNADYEGGSNQWLVCISKIDWNDSQEWLSDYRIISLGRPFISVFHSDDAAMISRLLTPQGDSQWTGAKTFFDGDGQLTQDPAFPSNIGYTCKKIASIDWNDTTLSWDVTQYEYGPISLPMERTMTNLGAIEGGGAPSPTTYQDYYDNNFTYIGNYSWMEGNFAYPGYEINPANWWYELVGT